MSETEEKGEIMWRYAGKLFTSKEASEDSRKVLHGVCAIERVRVTLEPEQERFYVGEVYPVEVCDRDTPGQKVVAEFWNPLGNRSLVFKVAEAHTAWLNEQDKNQIKTEGCTFNDGD